MTNLVKPIRTSKILLLKLSRKHDEHLEGGLSADEFSTLTEEKFIAKSGSVEAQVDVLPLFWGEYFNRPRTTLLSVPQKSRVHFAVESSD